jgi:hypothetical protein
MQERSGAVSSLQLKVLRRALDGVPHRKRFTSIPVCTAWYSRRATGVLGLMER